MVFHSVTGVDKREGRSPSFFNREEAVVIVDTMQKIMETRGRCMVSGWDDCIH